jgi:Cu-Zn family superoxide dismutase
MRIEARSSAARWLLWVGSAAMVLGGCAGRVVEAPSARAVLKDKDGNQVGVATLTQTPEGTRIVVKGYRLTPGPHGLHIHDTGVCQPPEFTSAGNHFNPDGRKHGRQNPDGPHAGDLPNLVIAAAGDGSSDVTTKAVTLAPGPTSLLGGKGTAIVIHAMADDDRTDPSGNSGDRIACGVITP